MKRQMKRQDALLGGNTLVLIVFADAATWHINDQ